MLLTTLFNFLLTLASSNLIAARDTIPPVLLNYSQSSSYYARQSLGLIHPTQAPESNYWFEHFQVSRKMRLRGSYDHVVSQGLFQLSDLSDLVGKKIEFYSGQDFNEKTQVHERKYSYLDTWRSLYHPPLKVPVDDLSVIDHQVKPWSEADANPAYFDANFHRKIDQQSGTHLTFGNDLKLLRNKDSFVEKRRLAQTTRKYFFGAVMVYFCDKSSSLLLDDLIQKKKAGMDVRIIVEGAWARLATRKCIRRMRANGIDVLLLSTIFDRESSKGVMHHKIWIRDGEEAIVGGMNMHDSENTSDGFDHMIRDSDVLIKRGPAVTDLLEQYVDLWRTYGSRKQAKELYPYLAVIRQKKDAEARAGQRGSDLYESVLSDPEKKWKGVCRLVVQRQGKIQAVAPVLYEYLSKAQHEVYWTTPSLHYSQAGLEYKAPAWNTRLVQKMVELGKQGVRTHVISNGYDGGPGALAGWLREFIQEARGGARVLVPVVRSLLDSLSRSGAKKQRVTLNHFSQNENLMAWQHFQYIHAKTQFFDRTVVGVGSYNLDLYSSERSHETDLICMDRSLRGEMERSFVLDLANSVPVVERRSTHSKEPVEPNEFSGLEAEFDLGRDSVTRTTQD